LADGNPVRGTDTAKEHRRDRVLSDDELAQVWRTLGSNRFGDIVRLLILTGQHKLEIADPRWSEIDLAKGPIKLPASRTNNKHSHKIPLSPMVRSILDRGNANASDDFVFGRFTAWSRPKAALDRRCALPAWTLYDLRRTCATGLGNLRVPPHVIETILNHRGGHKAGVAGTYNYSTYLEEVREALEKWGEACHRDRIRSSSGKCNAGLARNRPRPGHQRGLALTDRQRPIPLVVGARRPRPWLPLAGVFLCPPLITT
jgi:integrase